MLKVTVFLSFEYWSAYCFSTGLFEFINTNSGHRFYPILSIINSGDKWPSISKKNGFSAELDFLFKKFTISN